MLATLLTLAQDAGGGWDLTSAANWQRFGGRTHTMAVHFPIAMLIGAAIFEALRIVRRKREPSPTVLSCLVLATLTGVHAAVAGWLNADIEPHGKGVADLIETHRWFGIGSGAMALLALIVHLVARRTGATTARRIGAALIFAAAGVVGFTGHLGGSIVNGEDYLFEPLRRKPAGPATPVTAPAPPPSMPVAVPGTAGATPGAKPADSALLTYERDIRPILDGRCVECHGPAKSKGGLRLDSLAGIFGPDQDLWVIVPGKPDESELLRRITLPPTDDDHMPSDETSLGPDEIKTIQTWVEQGAGQSGANAPAAPPAAPTSESLANRAVIALDPGKPARLALDALREAGARVEPLYAGSTELEVNLSLAGRAINDAALAHVAALGGRVIVLNLSRTAITDAGAVGLGPLTALRTLHAQETALSDNSARLFATLPKLESINLFGTKLTDEGLTILCGAPALKRVVVWGTPVTPAGIAAARSAHPGIEIESGDE